MAISIIITDEGSTIKIDKSGTDTFLTKPVTIDRNKDQANEMILFDASGKKIFFFAKDVQPPFSTDPDTLQAEIEALNGTGGLVSIAILLADILTELRNDQDIEVRWIQDENGVVMTQVRKLNQETGAVTFDYFDHDGNSVATPDEQYPVIGKYNFFKQIGIANKNGTGYADGDTITRYRIVDHLDGLLAVTSQINYNENTGSEVTIPIADFEIIGDDQEKLLTNIITVVTKMEKPFDNYSNGREIISITGTQKPLAGISTPIYHVIVQALLTNVNDIAIGTSGIDATVGNEIGTILEPGDIGTIFANNLNLSFINGTIGDGVSWQSYDKT